MSKAQVPPRLIHRFFRWFCHPDLLPGVEGDLMELYNERLAESGKRKADRRFIIDVLMLFRPGLLRPSLIRQPKIFCHYDLARHSILTSVRVLRKDQANSIINVFGLTLGIASLLFILQYVRFEKSFDRFHSNSERIYRINYRSAREGEVQRNSAASPPMAARFFQEKIPDIQSAVRVYSYGRNDGSLTIGHSNIKFREGEVLFVDPGFFDVFSFPLVSGDAKTCLTEVRTMVMTASTAEKYFDDEDPVGRLVSVDGADGLYTITAIVKDPPKNSHIQFDILVSYKTLDWWWEGEAERNWFTPAFYTYALTKPTVSAEALQSKMNEIFFDERGKDNLANNFEQHFDLQPLSDIHFSSDLENEWNPNKQGDKATTQFLMIVGWFILFIAWINYINLSTARAIKRAKEAGIRKTLGAHRYQLIFRFIFESLIINLLASLLAVVIFFFSKDILSDRIGVSLDFGYMVDAYLLWMLLAVWFFGSLLSGIYPALVLSSLSPSTALTGSSATTGFGSLLRKLLVVFQFAVSVALIIGTIVMYLQLGHMKQKNAGFDRDHVIIIPGANLLEGEEYQGRNQLFMTELKKHPQVVKITTTNVIPGELINDLVSVQNENDSEESLGKYSVFWTGYDFLSTFDIELKEGRSFDRAYSKDADAILLNEKAVRLLGYDPPHSILGKEVLLNFKYPKNVIGIVKDFDQLISKSPVMPLIIGLDPDWAHYFAIRYQNDYRPIVSEAEKLYHQLYPRDPFDYFFLNEYYNRQYAKDESLTEIINLFSAIAILIACMGLYGLASYGATSRAKEIGIRKVFGASAFDIVFLISKEFTWLVIVANVLVWPIAYYFAGQWLSNFAFRIPISPSIFLIPALLVLAIAFLTTGPIAFKIAQTSPSKSLRNE